MLSCSHARRPRSFCEENSGSGAASVRPSVRHDDNYHNRYHALMLSCPPPDIGNRSSELSMGAKTFEAQCKKVHAPHEGGTAPPGGRLPATARDGT